MNEQLFDELLESVREGGAILRGEKKPSRSFEFEEPDVVAIRKDYGLSQDQFASLLGISVRTLQNWEQGRRTPHGPAKVLLRVAARHPEAILETVSSGRQTPLPGPHTTYHPGGSTPPPAPPTPGSGAPFQIT